MAVERTIVLIKPDAVYNKWENAIINRYTERGLRVVAQTWLKLSHKDAQAFYSEHVGKPFFGGLVLAMTSGSILALMLEGESAISVVRMINGATDPNKAEPGSIRHDFKTAGGPFNTVHGSDSVDAVMREGALICSLDHFFARQVQEG